ncbi:hypothetical protein [Rhodopirellula europaea]|nr:hypothetical protein [Rhodopirellula europaea]
MTMQRLAIYTTAVAACLLVTPTVLALTVAYGQRDMQKAGPGWVGGWLSAHGNTAYFCGDTERLNHQLAAIAQSNLGHSAAKVVLHAGKNSIDDPIEQPLTGFGERAPDRLPIDWSVRRSCPSSDVLRGRCQCNRRSVTVDIWIANDVELDSLSIPPQFIVESGGEIDAFVDRQEINKRQKSEQPNVAPKTHH